MTERFNKLFSLDKNLYTENSPIIIEAGALQYDNENSKVLAQCKFKNISKKVIKCVSISVQQMDTIGRDLGEPIPYQYLDLIIPRDMEFGSKNPIYLTDATTRSFKVFVKEVIFDDESIWQSITDSKWETIPEQNDLCFDDSELLKQYHLDINPKGTKEILKYKDIWKCSCGAINKLDESCCHSCHFSLDKMENVNIESLKKSVQERKDKEELDRKENQYKQACQYAEKNNINSQERAINLFNDLIDYKDSKEKIKKCESKIDLLKEESQKNKIKVKKYGKIGSCIALIVIVLCIIYSSFIAPKLNYGKAISALNDKDYKTAIELFESLDDYEDSKNQLSKAKRGLERQIEKEKREKNYKKAVECFKNSKDYSETISLLKDYPYYKDSAYYLIRSYYELGDYDRVLALKPSYSGKKLDDIFEDSKSRLNGKYVESVITSLNSGDITEAEATLKKCDDSTKNTFQPTIDKLKKENCLGTYEGDKGAIVVTCTVNEEGSYFYNVTLKAIDYSNPGGYAPSSIDDQTFTNFTDCNEMLICDYGSDAPGFIKTRGYNLYRAKFEYRCVIKKNGDNLDMVINEKCISVDSGAPYSAGKIFEDTQQYIRSN